MEGLFSEVSERIAVSENRIVATHKAMLDLVYTLPLSRADYVAALGREEQRFAGQHRERIGGGGINFALCSASVGHQNTYFVGVMDQGIFTRVRTIRTNLGLPLKLQPIICPQLQNVIVELTDGNFVLHGVSEPPNLTSIVNTVRQMRLGSEDWVASCSFTKGVTAQIVQQGKQIFLDSGYGYPRREAELLSKLLRVLRTSTATRLIIAANETEIGNIADELRVVEADPVEKARLISEIISMRIGFETQILLHTSEFATLADYREPGWVVPTFEIVPVRRTNAGDTFAGTFMAAHAAGADGALSCFYANAATAKRLAHDELPTPENVQQFLQQARLREQKPKKVPVLMPLDLRGRLPERRVLPCVGKA